MTVVSKYHKNKGKGYLSQQGKIMQTFLIQDNSIKNKTNIPLSLSIVSYNHKEVFQGLFFYFLAMPHALRDLSSPARD